MAFHISQELGGLPLALDQAGAYLEETGMHLLSYWHLYQQRRADLLRERRGLVADHPESVATTWSLSFKLVEEKNPAAADLLRLLAFLSPDAIAEEILTKGAPHLGPLLAPVAADALLLNRAIEALRAYSLVQRDPKEQTLSIHRLVQAVLQDQLSGAEKRIWAERAMLAVNAVFGPVEPDSWPQCERLLPQALMIAEMIKQQQMIGKQARDVLHKTASYLLDRARYAEVEPLFQQTLQILERQGEAEQPEGASVLYSLAYLSREQGNYAKAKQLFLQTLTIRERHLGPVHPDVGFTLDALAYLYLEQGKSTEAEPLFQRALQLASVHLEPEHPDMASPLTGLALTYCHQGKYAEAESLFRQALHVFERPLELEHPAVTHPLTGLANLYGEQGRYTEAETLFQRALQIRTQALGPEHPVTAEIMYDLARLREAQGNSEEACVWLRRALSVREQMLGGHHPRTIQTRKHLLTLLHSMGQHEEAAQLESGQPELCE